MLRILQARLQQYVNHELPGVQAGFRKARGIRDQIANIRWITEKVREFHKNIYYSSIDYVTINAGEGVGKREPSYTIGGNVNWYHHYGEQYRGSLNTKVAI